MSAHRVTLSIDEDHEMYQVRSTLLSIEARAAWSGDATVQALARRAFDTLHTLTSPEIVNQEGTR